MNPLLPLLLLHLHLSLVSTTAPPPPSTCKTFAAGVDPTCKAVARANPAIPYDYCVHALNSHPSAASQDLPGLAASAARLAISHAEATESRVDDLIDLEPDPALKHRHYLCQDAFDDASDALRDAFDSINTKQYAKAGRLLASSRGARGICEKGFTAGAQAPVSEADDEYERLAALAQAILAMVHYE